MLRFRRRRNIDLALVHRESIGGSTYLGRISGARLVADTFYGSQCGVQSIATIAFSAIFSPEVFITGAVCRAGLKSHRVICILCRVQRAGSAVRKINVAPDVVEVGDSLWLQRVESLCW
jgi:hypothetical protein